jgi:hypothetical protein
MESFNWLDDENLASADDMIAPRASGTAKTLLQEIQRGISVLHAPGTVIEMRIPKGGKLRTISGYFDDQEKLAQEIQKYSADESIGAVYYTLNPCNSALLARASNRSKAYADNTTSDVQIDVDVNRPAGICSTDAEKEAARSVTRKVLESLSAVSWPQPVIADSGNGWHLLYRIELPNDEVSDALVKSCLEALAAKFNNSSATIDTAVHNAARITKAYGSMVRKGDSTKDRPHRPSRLFRVPANIEVVPRERLEMLAKEAPQPAEPNGSTITAEKVEQNLTDFGISFRAQIKNGETWWHVACPNASSTNHAAGIAASVILRANGILAYSCFADQCAGKFGWKQFRAHYEQRAGKRMVFVDARPNRDIAEPNTSETSDVKSKLKLVMTLKANELVCAKWAGPNLLLIAGKDESIPKGARLEEQRG